MYLEYLTTAINSLVQLNLCTLHRREARAIIKLLFDCYCCYHQTKIRLKYANRWHKLRVILKGRYL